MCVLVLSGMKLERKALSLPVLSVVDAQFTDVDLIYLKLVLLVLPKTCSPHTQAGKRGYEAS